jgi:hypothetical protein
MVQEHWLEAANRVKVRLARKKARLVRVGGIDAAEVSYRLGYWQAMAPRVGDKAKLALGADLGNLEQGVVRWKRHIGGQVAAPRSFASVEKNLEGQVVMPSIALWTIMPVCKLAMGK